MTADGYLDGVTPLGVITADSPYWQAANELHDEEEW